MRWVAFIRNVMVGREGLRRDTLIELGHEAGGTDVRSHLSTGNLTFVADETAAAVLADGLEAAVRAVIGRDEMVALRPLPWLVSLVDNSPFVGLRPTEWGFEVAFLRHDAPPLDPSRLGDAQRTVITRANDRELFAARPEEGGQRPHVNRMLERATGTPATSRGWATLQRIVASRDDSRD
jgi:uncharacterized protein (DUF1697 family)